MSSSADSSLGSAPPAAAGNNGVMGAPTAVAGAMDTAAASDEVVAARLAVAGGQPKLPVSSVREVAPTGPCPHHSSAT